MNNKKYFTFFFFLFLNLLIFPQKKITTKVIDPLQKEALYREKVFIHLNKLVYFTGEKIWFTAYVAQDDNNNPSIYTSNLRINILNSDGDIIDQKNIFIKNGIGSGDFTVDDSWVSDNIYIQGFTNFMRNFGKENVFIQAVKIINPTKEEEKPQITNVYDIQVFPESGYLLESVDNTLGIKALINGEGYPFNGAILDSEGIEITSFKGNILGMGKCNFFYTKEENYTAIVNINNTTQKIKLPKALKEGVIFDIDNTDSNELKLSLKTNNETLKTQKNDTLSLIIYRNNFISKALTLTLNNDEKVIHNLILDKSKMQNGVNIITLFNNNKPIAERKFFIEKLNDQTALLIEKFKTEEDSLSFKVNTIDSNGGSVVSQLSISILPQNTKVFSETQNIKSAFLLSPYIKGRIENPAFYFKNENGNESDFLDLLLLNQGWSAYSLEEMIQKNNPKKQFDFENGFTINGDIKKYPKGYMLGIVSNKNKLIAISTIDNTNKFSFENIYAYKHDSIIFALRKKGEPLLKPNQIKLFEDKIIIENYAYLTSHFKQGKIYEQINSTDTNVKKSSFNNQYPNTEMMDEIVLNAKVSKKKISVYEKELNLAKDHNEISSEFFKNKKVTKQMEASSNTLFEYFRTLGHVKPTNENGFFISLRNAPVTLFGANKNPDNSYPPKIYVDNVVVPNTDIEIIKGIYMHDVDEILINKSGAGGGADAMGGIIKIYLKKGDHQYFEDEPKELYKKLLLLTGFDKAQAYYSPLYNIYSKEIYKWTEIDWKPSLKTNINGEIIFKIPKNKFSNDFLMIINGFSKEGLLFHDVYDTGDDDF